MRKKTSQQPDLEQSWAPNTYRTGSTTPPKSHNGIIALLLVLVIVLCGIITVLGITNAKLFRILAQEEDQDLPVFFSNSRNLSSSPADHASAQSDMTGTALSVPLGIHGESVPKVHQLYYRVPSGLYVNKIEPEASASRHGLQPGDIITHVDGFSVTSPEDFSQALANYAVGDMVILTVYRNNASFTLSLTVQPTR